MARITKVKVAMPTPHSSGTGRADRRWPATSERSTFRSAHQSRSTETVTPRSAAATWRPREGEAVGSVVVNGEGNEVEDLFDERTQVGPLVAVTESTAHFGVELHGA